MAYSVHSRAVVTRAAKTFGGVVASLLVSLPGVLVLSSPHVRALHRDLWHPSRVYQPLNTQPDTLPSVFFWAWERPEDFRFLMSQDAGVAFLAKTIDLPSRSAVAGEDPSSHITVRPRFEPLRVNPATPLVAVVRIETPLGLHPTAYDQASLSSVVYSQTQLDELASEIAKLQFLHSVRAIQIDFDATVSEREFYTSLLSDVRHKLSATVPLSITALASWCIGDPWLEHLPPGTIQEAVPMLFRMGPDFANVGKFLHSGENFPVAACQGSLGLSTDESLSRELLNGKVPSIPLSWRRKRVYLFAPRAWTSSSANSVLKEWQR